MATGVNEMRWDGRPGHYEVWYVTATDRSTGIGLWIRATMRAPVDGAPECSLWFLAMRPDGRRIGRKATFPIDRLRASATPFRLELGDAVLTDRGFSGAFEDVEWDLRWAPDPRGPFRPVDPRLERLGLARTVFVVPHPDLSIDGLLRFGATRLELEGAKGGQSHLWGTKHATRWAWAHCNDFCTLGGEPVPDTAFEAVSVHVPRFGRPEFGPSTPVVARWRGREVAARGPVQISRAQSRFGLTSWVLETQADGVRLRMECDAPRPSLVGVTYQDPDGEKAWCYNSEVATMRLHVWEREGRGASGWTLRETLVAEGTGHVEYGQRSPVEGVELLTT